MSVVDSLLGSIRKEKGDRFTLADLNLILAAIRAGQVANVAPPLMMKTGQGGSLLSIKKSMIRDMMDLPFEVQWGAKDGKTPCVRIFRNGGVFRAVDGERLAIDGESEKGVVETAFSAADGKKFAVSLIWEFKIEEEKNPAVARKASVEVKAVAKNDDVKPDVTTMADEDSSGKGRVVLAVGERKGSLVVMTQCVFTSLRAHWCYKVDDASGQGRLYQAAGPDVGLPAIEEETQTV